MSSSSSSNDNNNISKFISKKYSKKDKKQTQRIRKKTIPSAPPLNNLSNSIYSKKSLKTSYNKNNNSTIEQKNNLITWILLIVFCSFILLC